MQKYIGPKCWDASDCANMTECEATCTGVWVSFYNSTSTDDYDSFLGSIEIGSYCMKAGLESLSSLQTLDKNQ
jgi:hypothetical protein